MAINNVYDQGGLGLRGGPADGGWLRVLQALLKSNIPIVTFRLHNLIL